MNHKQPNGSCPYCLGNNYDAAKTVERKLNQDKMYCMDCDQWSVRRTPSGTQYPTDDPATDAGDPLIRTA